METLTISLDGSSDNEIYNIAPLLDAELAKTYRFSISFLIDCDGTCRVETVTNLSITHRIFELATDGPSGEEESGSSKYAITADSAASPTRCKPPPGNNYVPKSLPLVLASNTESSDGKAYILSDPDDEEAGNMCIQGTMLGRRDLVFVFASEELETQEDRVCHFASSGKKHIYARQHRLTKFKPELPYGDGLNVTYECHRTLMSQRLTYDWPDGTSPMFSALVRNGATPWHAHYYRAIRSSSDRPLAPFTNTDIYSIIRREEKSEEKLNCSLHARQYHLRLASKSIHTFRSNTEFKIKGHTETYTLAPLPTYSIFSIGVSSPSRICDVDRDIDTLEATKYHESSNEELDDSETTAHNDAEADPEQETNDMLQEVVWGSDFAVGLSDNEPGVITFCLERSGEVFQAIPRAQIVQRGCRSGFVLMSEVEKSRTLAVRDHNLLHKIYNDGNTDEDAEEMVPVIQPLVGNDMHAIFQLICSENGDEIEASPLGD
ncbi:hypothetical protein D0865_04950 [Hortaea werneckii]|uniref:Uncharacterized protein n=1 Tax=Hortaea werneckii TaxID=91943 RepID=A0A3M7CQ86_HORWE|nr:hypothetical protein D0865_04950 [Hortaea werneckii]